MRYKAAVTGFEVTYLPLTVERYSFRACHRLITCSDRAHEQLCPTRRTHSMPSRVAAVAAATTREGKAARFGSHVSESLHDHCAPAFAFDCQSKTRDGVRGFGVTSVKMSTDSVLAVSGALQPPLCSPNAARPLGPRRDAWPLSCITAALRHGEAAARRPAPARLRRASR